MTGRRLLGALLALLIGALARADLARAHATLLAATPPEGSVLAQTPAEIILRFDEPVTPLVFSLARPDGAITPLRRATARGAGVAIALDDAIPQGSSLLSWRVVSADGHPVGGSVGFSIGRPGAPPDAGVSQTSGPRAVAIWLLRIAFFVSLLGGVGGAFFRVWIDPDPAGANRADRMLTAALWLGLLISPAILAGQGLDALGLPVTEILAPEVWTAAWSTSLAATMLAAGAALCFALAALRWRAAFVARPLASIGLLGAGFALALSGHASTAEPHALMRALVLLHGVCVALWTGALMPLFALAGEPKARFVKALQRFSAIAVPTVAVLVAGGLALAAVQVREPAAVWTSEYGRALVAKLIAVAALLALAARNRFRLTPAIGAGAPRAARRLRHAIGAEIALALGVFAIVALWRFTPPPRALLLAQAQPTSAHFHTDKAMADIELRRDAGGGLNLRLRFLAGDFGPLAPKAVHVSLSLPEAGVEAIEREASGDAEDVWRAGPIRLPPVKGYWTLRLDVLIDDFDTAVLQDRIVVPRDP